MPEQITANPAEELKSFIAEQLGITKARIDKMDGKVEEALHEMKKAGTPAEVVEQIGALQLRLDKAEAKAIGVPSAGAHNELRKAIAESPYVRSLRENGIGQLNQPGFRGMPVPSYLKKVDIDTTSLIVPANYRAGVVNYQLDQTTLLDRIRRVPVNADTYRYIKETRISGEGGIVTTSDGAIVGGASNVITFLSVSNLLTAGSTGTIERTNGSGTLLGYETFTVASFNPGTRVVTMTQNIAGNVADGDKICFTPYTATTQAAAKPYTWLGTEEVSATLEMVAVLAAVTQQIISSDSGLEAWMQEKMRRTHNRSISKQLLYGIGSAGELNGFLAAAGAGAAHQNYTWSSGSVGDTMADCVMKAALLIPDESSVSLEATMTRTNWLQLLGEKAVDGHYIYGSTAPISVIDRPGLKALGSILVRTDAMVAANGDFLLADHDSASELAVKGGAQFQFGYVNDDFARNKLTARYEEQVQHIILSLQSYVHGNFDARP